MAIYVFAHEPPVFYSWWDNIHAEALKSWAQQDEDETIFAWILKHSAKYPREHRLMNYAYELAELLADEHIKRRERDTHNKQYASVYGRSMSQKRRMFDAQFTATYKEILKGL